MTEFSSRGSRPAAVSALAVLLAGLLAVALGGHMRPTAASFNDAATMTVSHSSHAVLPPTSVSCVNVGGAGSSVRLSFPHRDIRYDYTVQIARTSDGAVVTNRGGTVIGSGAAGGSLTMDVDNDFTSVTLFDPGAVNYTVTVRSKLKSSAAWLSSSVATTRLFETRTFLELWYRVYCGTG